MTRIAVYGATGTTGALVVREVLSRGHPCRALARDGVALTAGAAALRIGDVDLEATACDADAASLAPALSGVDIVINCAGPFHETRRAVEDAAMRAGVAVVHVCGEPQQVVEMLARDAELAAAGITVVGAAGFSSTVAELACWLAIKGLTAPLAIELVHASASSVPSAGSLRSYLAGAPHGAQDAFDAADAADAADASGAHDDIRVVELPPPIGARAVRATPLVERFTLPRSLPAVVEVSSFVAVGPPRTAALKPAAFMRDRVALQEMLAWREAQGRRGPDAEERARMAFALVAIARSRASDSDDDAAARTLEMVGVDPYGLTALLAVQVAVDVLRSGKPGARTPLEVLDPQPALAALARAGVRWTSRR